MAGESSNMRLVIAGAGGRMGRTLIHLGRYGEAIGAGEVDVGPITEAWDIGVAPKPEGPVPLRVLVMNKADTASEAGTPRSPQVEANLNALVDDMKSAGVFLGVESLAPSSKAVRLQRVAGKIGFALLFAFSPKGSDVVAEWSLVGLGAPSWRCSLPAISAGSGRESIEAACPGSIDAALTRSVARSCPGSRP